MASAIRIWRETYEATLRSKAPSVPAWLEPSGYVQFDDPTQPTYELTQEARARIIMACVTAEPMGMGIDDMTLEQWLAWAADVARILNLVPKDT